jgi:hypothetical protein
MVCVWSALCDEFQLEHEFVFHDQETIDQTILSQETLGGVAVGIQNENENESETLNLKHQPQHETIWTKYK